MCGPIVPGSAPGRRPARIPKNPNGAAKGKKKIVRPESYSDYDQWLKSQGRRFNRRVTNAPEPKPKLKRQAPKGDKEILAELQTPNPQPRKRTKNDISKPARPTQAQRDKIAKAQKPKKPTTSNMTRYPPRRAGETALNYEKRLRAWRRRMGK